MQSDWSMAFGLVSLEEFNDPKDRGMGDIRSGHC